MVSPTILSMSVITIIVSIFFFLCFAPIKTLISVTWCIKACLCHHFLMNAALFICICTSLVSIVVTITTTIVVLAQKLFHLAQWSTSNLLRECVQVQRIKSVHRLGVLNSHSVASLKQDNQSNLTWSVGERDKVIACLCITASGK